MTDKTNVVSLFGPEKTDRRKLIASKTQEEVSTLMADSRQISVPHRSWTRDEIIGALASNACVLSASISPTVFVTQSTKYSTEKLLIQLKEFIEKSLNKGLKDNNLYCRWEENSLFVYRQNDNSRCAKLRVELSLNSDNSTDIDFYHIDKKS